MTKPKILVAIIGNSPIIESILVRRRMDELFVVFSDNEWEIADTLATKFSNLGIQVLPIHIQSLKFSSILASLLRALNNKSLDGYDIEFAVSTGNPLMTLASCIAAAIVNASVLCTDGSMFTEISEQWPAKLVNITHKKRQILNFLETFNDSIHQKDISRETGICQSGVSRHLQDLELAGYVKRTRVARKKVVRITELGSVILHQKEIRKRRIWDAYSVERSSVPTLG